MSEEDNDRKLVLLTDFIEQRTRKDNEIKYYEEQLKDIERRLFFLRKEHDLTTTIIDIITREKIPRLFEGVLFKPMALFLK